MSKNLGGRPKSISDEELLQALENYVNNHNGEKIILSKLAIETKIARHIWDYSIKVKQIIDKVNNPIIVVSQVSDELKTLPSPESLSEETINNPNKLLEAYGSCIKIINNLTEKVRQSYEFEKKVALLEKQVIDLKNENKGLVKQLMKQEKTMLELCVKSESLREREINNLNNNILTIDTNNIERVLAVREEDIKKQFPWLED